MLRTNDESTFSRAAREAGDQIRNNTDDEGFRAFSFTIKDFLVFGTVLVSVVSAWGMINTRITLAESAVTALKETHRLSVEKQEAAVAKLEDELDGLRLELSQARDHIRDVESTVRRYSYTIRRLQQDKTTTPHKP
jgi:septal ring factor EnvC (AmiA/AmiB activator)